MLIAETAKQAGAYLAELREEAIFSVFSFYFGRQHDVRDHDHTVPADLTPNSNIQQLRTSETHRIRVDFIRSFEFPFLNRLGMTFAPGKKQTDAFTGIWDRDLRTDLERLSNAFRVRTLVSLLEDKEFEEFQIRDFAAECARTLINVVRFPIRDVSVPESMEDFVLMAAGVVDSLKHGETVVTHCKGGLGRAGLTAACIAVAATDAEISASEAIRLVREARPGAVETETQEQFVAEFEKEWRAVMAKRDQRGGNSAKTSEELLVRTAEFTTESLAVSRQLSDKHFLLCWKEQSVLAAQSSPHSLDVVSSRQINRVKAGDTIWIVFVNQVGELVLAGRLKAAEVVDYLTAVRRLHDANLWDGDYYALAEEGTAEEINLINLRERALELRFKNSGSDRLKLTNGKIKAQQLGAMRELTEESAQMLSEIWENAVFDFDDDSFDDINEFDDEKGFDELVEFSENEDPVRLLEHFRQLVREHPDDADAHYNFGVACDENDLPEEANAAYRKTIELDPDYLGAYYNLGQNYLRADKLDESEQSFKAAIRLDPEFAPARFMLGVVYGVLGDFEKAIRTTKEGLQYAPDDPKGYFNVGNFYSHLQNYEKAAEWFEKSVEIDHDNPKTFYRLGECYRHLGEKQKEFDAYLQAFEVAPNFVDALFALGTVYAHLTGTDEGERVSYFETGGELILSDPRVSFYFGLGNLALGNFDIAQDSQTDLRKTDEGLAERLQFFIDRFVPDDENEDDSEEFDLHWLESEESGFAIRVLDCRPFTETRVAFAAEEQNALTFLSTRDSSGEQHREKSPENARSFSCDLSYSINALVNSPILNSPQETRDLPEGKLFSAAEMEEKWDVYYFDKSFYFVRSWTDKIAYRARVEERGLHLVISEIEYDKEIDHGEDYHLRAVDFLLKTFVIGLTVPHPVSDDIENNPQSIALSSFSFAGRHAKFASFEDTISSINTLQAMDYVGSFDVQRIKEQEEKEKVSLESGTAENSGFSDGNQVNPAQTDILQQSDTSKKRELIEVDMDGRRFEAKSIPQLYKAILQYLVDNEKLVNVSVPVWAGEKRYILAKEPVHPSGKRFFSPVEYGGFYLEAHNNRPTALKLLKNFVESLGVNFEIAESETQISTIESSVKKQSAQTSVEQRFLGSLIGLAAGDALGTTVEFKPTGTFPPVTTISGGGPFELNAGEWTDDTSMALCLADSLIESGAFDPADQMRRYCRWKNEGYLSSNGVAFDIGNTVRRALEKFEQQASGEEFTAYCGSVSPSTAGNGSLMRLAPVPLFFANDPAKAIKLAGESSRTTHGARECVDACRYFAALVIGAVQGKSKEEILSAQFTPLPGLWDVEPLAPKVAEIAEGSFKSPRPPEITGAIQGYVIPSLHAALWAFYHTDNFADGALKVVNLGYDADTYGAIYGQIAGAYYGTESIPNEWLNLITKRDLIESLAQSLYEASVG